MSWTGEHKRIWRLAFLGLLIVALSGPWGFDRIHVPSAYPCSAPFVRLDEDFCGLPVSPISFFTEMIVQPLWSVITGTSASISGTALGDIIQYLIFSAFLLPPLLPLLSTLILVLRGDRRGWLRFHIVVLGLAAGVGVLVVFFSFMARPGLAIWGAWSYISLAAVMLLLETLAPGVKRRYAHE